MRFYGLLIAIFLVLVPHTTLADQDEDSACMDYIVNTAVRSAALGLGGVLHNLPTDTHEATAQSYVEPVRFFSDASGYFFIFDYSGKAIAHGAQSELTGKNLSDYRDQAGNQVILKLAQTAQNGGGFLEYYWQKPNSNQQSRKLSYVEPIPGTTWFIGAGVYLE